MSVEIEPPTSPYVAQPEGGQDQSAGEPPHQRTPEDASTSPRDEERQDGSAPDESGGRVEADAAYSPGTCWACQEELTGGYFEVDDHTLCATCTERVREAQRAGSPVVRLARALGFGTMAALLGSGIYYAIRAATDMEFGLIAIVVGFMVGVAVKVGCHGRGGWVYQLIAIALTYVAIVSTYVPDIVEVLQAESLADPAADDPAVGASANDPTGEASSGMVPPSTSEGATPAAPAAPSVFLYVFAFVVSLFAPFLMGFDNAMGTIILLIGLYEAWKINKREAPRIAGPFGLAHGPVPGNSC